MDSASRVLLVDDDPGMLRYLRTLLEVDSYQVEEARSGTEALNRVRANPCPDLVLLDLLMPEMDGLETLSHLRRLRRGVRVIMVTCEDSAHKAVQALRLGAQDYLTKPFRKDQLDVALKTCLELEPIPTEPFSQTMPELDEHDSLFIATSPAMLKVRARALQVANINVPVLLLGESGTGKEVIARQIYKNSARANRTFMKINCAALPGELLESELFGFEPGAFTGATRSKPGKFELCDKGTLFLDEIAEMPTGLQAKLLQALQDQEFFRLGGRLAKKVDVRILAATNVDIHQAIAAKKFREDLYYRLNAVVLHLPPLRTRKEEIPLFLKHFIAYWSDRYALPRTALSAELLDACYQYSWPGNVRELENLAKRYLILGDEALVLSEMKTEQTQARAGDSQSPGEECSSDLKSIVRDLKSEAEMKAIARTLEMTNWSRKEAARILNISYKALLYKIRQYGIDR